jgi:hypothetical protein
MKKDYPKDFVLVDKLIDLLKEFDKQRKGLTVLEMVGVVKENDLWEQNGQTPQNT